MSLTTKDTRTVADAITLTGSYVTQSSPAYFEITDIDQVNLDVSYTMGAAETSNSLQLKVEFANPKNNDPVTADWHQQISESTSSGTTTISLQSYTFAAVSAAATYDRFQIAIPVNSKFMRISYKETGIAANEGTLTLKATLRQGSPD